MVEFKDLLDLFFFRSLTFFFFFLLSFFFKKILDNSLDSKSRPEYLHFISRYTISEIRLRFLSGTVLGWLFPLAN